MKVLVTNCALQTHAGSELYVRDVVRGLRRAGHSPVVWSPMLGAVADEIRATGVPVHGDLADVPEPDLVHGQMHDETIAALSRFPDRPGLFVQHSATLWQDATPVHPRLRRYLAVDYACLERIAAAGVAPSMTSVVPNGVDLDRFRQRDPLPRRPRRALVLSNYAGENTHLPAVREACARMGVVLEVAGAANGTPTSNPESSLPAYDLVFAKARAALEALAVGCAVVVADVPGIAGMVRHENLPEWRRWNFGRRLLTAPHDVELLCTEIARYDADDAARCTEYVRTHYGLDAVIDQLVVEYERVLEDWGSGAVDHRAELVAVSARLSLIGPLRAREEAERPYVEQYPQLAEAWRTAVRHADGLLADRDGLRAQLERVRLDTEQTQP